MNALSVFLIALIICFLVCIFFLRKYDRELKLMEEEGRKTPLKFDEYLSSFEGEYDRHIEKVINSCQDSEQLLNAQKWAYNIYMDKIKKYFELNEYSSTEYPFKRVNDKCEDITDLVIRKSDKLHGIA